MEPRNQLSHPKPLAFTEASGVSHLRKAIYRSTELRAYCNSFGDNRYQTYLDNPEIVVIDDSTLVLDRVQDSPVNPIVTAGFEAEIKSLETRLSNGADINEDVVEMLNKYGLT